MCFCALTIALAYGKPAVAQPVPTGNLSAFLDFFPNRDNTVELRARLFVEEKIEPSPNVRLTLSGFAEGLVARRPVVDAGTRQPGTETDAIVRVMDANVEITSRRVDLLAGYARVVWGKLDELQPTDVINPLDISRFFFEGRAEARLPVLLVRGRVHVSDNAMLDAIYVPDFRRGRFDQLAEPSSPFNIATDAVSDPVVCLAIGCPTLPLAVADREPAFTARNAQGGVRLSATSGRVDWSVSAYRGFESFGFFSLNPTTGTLALEYPRFTMIGGDFEAVRGDWGLRGEVAAFVDDTFQSPAVRLVAGRSFDAGMGVDREAGDYTLSGTVLVHAEWYDAPLSLQDPSDGRTDVSFIASADRTFRRERYRLRMFGVYNASESSGFLRAIGIMSLRDNWTLENSVGWFAGGGRDIVGRFGDSDFLYAKLKYYF
jgi:hypothetical protein